MSVLSDRRRRGAASRSLSLSPVGGSRCFFNSFFFLIPPHRHRQAMWRSHPSTLRHWAPSERSEVLGFCLCDFLWCGLIEGGRSGGSASAAQRSAAAEASIVALGRPRHEEGRRGRSSTTDRPQWQRAGGPGSEGGWRGRTTTRSLQ